VPNWYIDPANSTTCASDANTCTSATCVSSGVGPCLTYNQIISRWTTRAPILAQTTTLTQLSAETLGQEYIAPSPILVNEANLVIVGTPGLSIKATQAIVTVTPKDHATGQLLAVTVASAAGIVVGQQAINTSRGSKARVSAVVGTTITFDTPFDVLTPADASFGVVPTEDDGWAIGNTLTFDDPPLINLKVLAVRGGDASASAVGDVAWLQDLLIPDVSGSPGNSEFTPNSPDAYINMVDCEVQPFMATLQGAGNAASVTLINVGMPGIATLTATTVYGGEIDGGGSTDGTTFFDFDTVVSGGIYVGGSLSNVVSRLYIGAGGDLNIDYEGNVVIDNENGGACSIWGPGGIANLGKMTNDSGTTWVDTILASGGMTLDGAGTATSATLAGTWTFTGAIAVTPANLDAHNGLQNPLTRHGYGPI
jgi:hypothetical protein